MCVVLLMWDRMWRRCASQKKTKNWAWQEMKVRVFSLKTKVLCTTEMLQYHKEEPKLWHEVVKGYQWTEHIFGMSRAVNYMWQGRNQTVYFKQSTYSRAVNVGPLEIYSDESLSYKIIKSWGNQSTHIWKNMLCLLSQKQPTTSIKVNIPPEW